jgi:hypothetical protein
MSNTETKHLTGEKQLNQLSGVVCEQIPGM